MQIVKRLLVSSIISTFNLNELYIQITNGTSPTDQTSIKEDLLSLISLPSLIIKLVRLALKDVSSLTSGLLTVLAEGLRTFGIIATHAFPACKPLYLKYIFPLFPSIIAIQQSPQVQLYIIQVRLHNFQLEKNSDLFFSNLSFCRLVAYFLDTFQDINIIYYWNILMYYDLHVTVCL